MPMVTKLTGWWLTWRGSYSQYYSNLWSWGFKRWSDKLKPLYLLPQCLGHQTWQIVTYLEVVLPIKPLKHFYCMGTNPSLVNHNPTIFLSLQELENGTSPPRQTKIPDNSNVLHMFIANKSILDPNCIIQAI